MSQSDRFMLARTLAIEEAKHTGIARSIWQMESGEFVVQRNDEPGPEKLCGFVLRAYPDGSITWT